MKRMLSALAVPLLLAATSFADKPTFTPYGFVKGDMYYATGPVTSWGKPALTCVSRAAHDTVGGTGLSFTA